MRIQMLNIQIHLLTSLEERLKECGLTTVKRRSNRNCLNVYENIDRNILSHSRKIIELEDMR